MSYEISSIVESHAGQWLLMERLRREQERITDTRPFDHERSTVTISREYGAGGHTIAAMLIERLGHEWQMWDREIVDEVARSAKVRAQIVEGFDEHTLSTAEQTIRYLANYWGLSPDKYHKHLVEALVRIGHRGKTIIIGRGANFVLPRAIKVRLCASESYRIQAVASREGLSEQDALKRIREVDRERASFARTMFNKAIDSPAEYDMVLRTDHISAESIAAAISGAVMEHMRVVR